ncbi:Fc.00g018930.m01.CDS01, partial [Cosmosporella sp. VM-42]
GYSLPSGGSSTQFCSSRVTLTSPEPARGLMSMALLGTFRRTSSMRSRTVLTC